MRGSSPSPVRRKKPAHPQDQEPKRHARRGTGKLFVVSLGPGGGEYLSPLARQVLERAEVIVGYDTYMGLLDPGLLKGKETVATGMRKEMERCRAAIEKALAGKQTAVVSSGDAGIYGMAGLVLELLHEAGLQGKVEVEVIPGIPALAAAAALLGAPLMHDFAVVSLSDLLTPWDVIRSRIEAAAMADYVIVLYNPRSRRRNWQLAEVKEILLLFRNGSTPVGIVKNAMREGQGVEVTTLKALDDSKVDMLSILVVGNSRTRILGKKMVTPRGYLQKYGAGDKVNRDSGSTLTAHGSRKH